MPATTPRIIGVIIPCYRSEHSIRLVVNEIREVVAQRPEYDYRIIAVNDCSPDNVSSVLHEIAAQDHKVTAIDLAKNSGRHNALMCGCRYVQADYIVFCDDDQQCPVDRLWDLLDPLLDEGASDEGASSGNSSGKGASGNNTSAGTYDVSIARYPKKTQAIWKNFGSKLNDAVATWLLNKDPDLKFSNFSAMKAFVKDEVIKYTNPYPYLSGLMISSTSRVCNVDMEERTRTIGTSGYTFRKSLGLWLNSFTSFSVKPLRLATICGFLLALVGLVLLVYFVVRKIILPEVLLGYSSTMAAILFIGGMLMIMLGLIGEYIGRIYISLNNLPQYVVRDLYTQAPEQADSPTTTDQNRTEQTAR